MLYTKESTREIIFPLGGIGTGCIGLAGNGRLVDFEIFNRPNKGSDNSFTHFAVRVKDAEGNVAARVLNTDVTKDLTGQYLGRHYSGYGFGPLNTSMCGFPHFRNGEFLGEFPIAALTLRDDDFPLAVRLEAFNPLIPLNPDDSSLPAAFFDVTLENIGDRPLTVGAAFSVANPFSHGTNACLSLGDRPAIFLKNTDQRPDEYGYGDLTLASDATDAHPAPYWYRGGWQDGIATFWREFSSGEPLLCRDYREPGQKDVATLAIDRPLAPGEKTRVRFLLSWNAPVNRNDWTPPPADGSYPTWRNYYATLFEDSAATADYALRHYDRLYEATRLFRDTLFSSTLDPAVLDAVSSCLAVLKSPTVWRLEDGSFYGWEGVHEKAGSCEGTCTHVYSYAYALCFLFPSLERSIRELEFRHSVLENGEMHFRLQLPPKMTKDVGFPCADGQFATVFKTYREWKISGDDAWLTRHYPTVKRLLSYAFSKENPYAWDADGDGVLEGRQHHTLDMELFGPSAWLQGMYLAALRAAERMAEHCGDAAFAATCRALFEGGYAFTKEHLFNGRYFIQKIDLHDKTPTERFDCPNYWNEETGEIKYQIGEGCAIDQLLGAFHADLLGLGDIFDREQVDTALSFMADHNFKESMRGFANPWRIFALNDESGAIICDYPEGAYKPTIPIAYCEESMHGFEYAFATLLCSRGHIEEGLRSVRSIRARYAGHNRNPWNEIECGSNYARSMAAFALLPILSGMTFDLSRGEIGFAPRVAGDTFRCLFSLGTGWGRYEESPNASSLTLLGGHLTLTAFACPHAEGATRLVIDGREVDFRHEGGAVLFPRTEIRQSILVE